MNLVQPEAVGGGSLKLVWQKVRGGRNVPDRSAAQYIYNRLFITHYLSFISRNNSEMVIVISVLQRRKFRLNVE